MKQLYFIIALILTAATGFTQTYYKATANKSGNFSDMTKWDYEVRNDNKKITTVIIPKNITIRIDESTDMESFGDVEFEILGTLELRSNRSLQLTANSKVTIKEGGLIDIDQNAKNEKKDKKNKKNEQITIGDVVKFDGNVDGSISGPAAATKTTGSSPMGFSSNAMLPVNFVSFTATSSNNIIGLTWTTTDEKNNSHFEIQRSTDGANFKGIAIVLPATDNNSINQYKYNDKFVAKGIVYYRIRQVDNDGREKFSQVKVIGGMNAQADARIYVSANRTIVVEMKNEAANMMVRLVSMNGAVISQKMNAASAYTITLSAHNAPAGAYIVQVSDMKGTWSNKKVIL